MKVVIDIEANGLHNPDRIWLVVCKDIATDKIYIFRDLTTNGAEKERFLDFDKNVSCYIGHNILGYDYPVLNRLIGLSIPDVSERTLDTLIISKMVDYPRDGHSIEDYGLEFNYPKGNITDFSKWSQELEDYCIRDVEITHKIYNKYIKYINNKDHKLAIDCEHKFQMIVNKLETNGFAFNKEKAEKLLEQVTKDLAQLDKDILASFPPRTVVVREFIPKATKHGTISKTSVPRSLWENLHEYEAGKVYQQTKQVPFNPSSAKQIIEVLTEAGWQPIDKTKTHISTERRLNQLNRLKQLDTELDLERQALYNKLLQSKKFGWKINETNLDTLPSSSPSPARSLAKRILLEARRRTLTEWLGLVREDGRIHGKFYGIGAWTHRMAHQNPNTANIPNEFNLDGKPKLLGKYMRALWQAPKGRLLVGVDAESIQLRIFAHYINDPDFTKSIVEGRKEDKTDPHNFNMSILGPVCKSRAAAKRFIFALLLGAGNGKLSEILGCSKSETDEALDRLLKRYTGFAKLKKEVIPHDAKRGWFSGLDGRKVRIPGETASDRRHLCMSGYLQTGEAVVMKHACILWHEQLERDKALKDVLWMLVNFVHDEWQTEVPNNVMLARYVAETQANALKTVGEMFGLNCPMAGSYWNDDLKDFTIGTNWKVTH